MIPDGKVSKSEMNYLFDTAMMVSEAE